MLIYQLAAVGSWFAWCADILIVSMSVIIDKSHALQNGPSYAPQGSLRGRPSAMGLMLSKTPSLPAPTPVFPFLPQRISSQLSAVRITVDRIYTSVFTKGKSEIWGAPDK